MLFLPPQARVNMEAWNKVIEKYDEAAQQGLSLSPAVYYDLMRTAVGVSLLFFFSSLSLSSFLEAPHASLCTRIHRGGVGVGYRRSMVPNCRQPARSHLRFYILQQPDGPESRKTRGLLTVVCLSNEPHGVSGFAPAENGKRESQNPCK